MKVKKSDITKKKILDMGVKLWPDVTAREIARRLDMTHPSIAYHFGSGLKDAVAEHAVRMGNSKVIAQLIATKHKAVKSMDCQDKQKHLSAVSGV